MSSFGIIAACRRVCLLAVGLLGTYAVAAPAVAAWPAMAAAMQQAAVTAGVQGTGLTERGIPFFYRHYQPDDYKAHPQNWAAVQDDRGLLYVANYDGLLVFDGVSWHLYALPRGLYPRALAVASESQVHVGSSGEFGYFQPNAYGRLQYTSLSDALPDSLRDFGDVWTVQVLPSGVYYQSTHVLFRWDGQALTWWTSDLGYHKTFAVGDDLYVQERNRGLLRLQDQALRLIPDGDRFARHAIYLVAPHPSGDLLIATRTSSAPIYRHNGVEAVRFPTEVDSLFGEYRFYSGRRIGEDHYALGFKGGGIAIIGADGRLHEHIDETLGLPNAWANDFFIDRQLGLWVLLNNQGIARIDVPSPLTFFDSRHGFSGSVVAMQRFKGALYVGTNAGLYRLTARRPGRDAADAAGFTPILPGRIVFDLVLTDSALYAATDRGVYSIEEGQPPRLLGATDGLRVFTLLFPESETPTGTFDALVGSDEGLLLFSAALGDWERTAAVDELTSQAYELVEDRYGRVWTRTRDNRIALLERVGASYQVTTTVAAPLIATAHGADTTAALADDPYLNLTLIQGQPVAVFGGRLWHLSVDDGTVRLRENRRAASLAGPIRSLTETSDGRLLVSYPDSIVYAEPFETAAGPGYRLSSRPELRFDRSEYAVPYLDGEVLWIGETNRLFRHDPTIEKPYQAPFSAVIRRIVDDVSGAIYYDGYAAEPAELHLPDGVGPVRIEVAATTYTLPGSTVYQYAIDDGAWSEWVPFSHAIYELGWGSHALRVRAHHPIGGTSPLSTLHFRIPPPWFAQAPAFLLYAVLLLLVVGFVWHQRRLREERRAFRQAQDQAALLQHANDQLEKASKLKDEFLAATSHELRTPLTAILGFTSVLRDEVPDHLDEFVLMIDDNSNRLLRTVNQILDFIELKSNGLTMQPRWLDLNHEIDSKVRFLIPLARQKEIDLRIEVPDEPVHVYHDPDRIGQILYNLVGNAIKFTSEGSVQVRLSEVGDGIAIEVRDTGIGISPSFMPMLFEEFKQESAGNSRTHQGSGLGLAITARLVDLMGGVIHVDSEPGRGSTFRVTLPLRLVPEIDLTDSAGPLETPAASGETAP